MIVLVLSIQASAQNYSIPSWVKNISLWYGQGEVSDTEFINALQYLINNKILIVEDLNDNNVLPKDSQNIIKDSGDFHITYYPNPNSPYEYSADEWLKDSQYFEGQIEYLNGVFRLPYDVEIIAKECKEPTAYYDLGAKQIVMCYEFADDAYEDFSSYYADEATDEEISTMNMDVIDFVFYHELGHALVDIYQLPITGLEENAVDQFATYFMLLTEDSSDYEGIVGQDILYNIGTWFYIQSQAGHENIYWDTHGLDIQRFYNISCYAYGENPEYNQDLITEGSLPKERAANCEYEYSVLKNSWETILSPYFI